MQVEHVAVAIEIATADDRVVGTVIECHLSSLLLKLALGVSALLLQYLLSCAAMHTCQDLKLVTFLNLLPTCTL